MAYQSLYRRYRSQKFSEVLGQPLVTSALRTAVAEGRHGHAYLFSGPRGTGKTSTARVLAKALNCENLTDGEPCTTCASCVAIEEGKSFDLHELDAASHNKVDDIRDLISKVQLGSPGRTKVYILDEVHMLSSGAENALLKTLEEPPDHVVFVLATTEPQKVVATIRSRTQHFEFHLLPADVLTEHVKWVIEDASLDVDDDAIDYVLRQGGGSARDTLSALDLVAAAGGVPEGTDIAEALIRAIGEGDPAKAIAKVQEGLELGREPRTIGEELLDLLRNAFLASMGAPLSHLNDRTRSVSEALSAAVGPATLTQSLEAIGQSLVEMRQAADPRVPLEVTLLRLTRRSGGTAAGAAAGAGAGADDGATTEQLTSRIEALEAKIARLEEATRTTATSTRAGGPGQPTPATSGGPAQAGTTPERATTGARRGGATGDRSSASPEQAGTTADRSSANPERAGTTADRSTANPERAGATADRSTANPERAGATVDRSSADPERAGATGAERGATRRPAPPQREGRGPRGPRTPPRAKQDPSSAAAIGDGATAARNEGRSASNQQPTQPTGEPNRTSETKPSDDTKSAGLTTPSGDTTPSSETTPSGDTKPSSDTEPSGDTEPTGDTTSSGDADPAGLITPSGGARLLDDATATSAFSTELENLSQKVRVRFKGGRVMGVDDGTIRFGVPNAIHQDRCRDVKGEVEQALSVHFGRAVTIEVEVDGSSEPPIDLAKLEPRPQPSAADGATEEDIGPVEELKDANDHSSGGVDRLTKAFPGSKVIDSPAQ